jgi:hypothetical protein
MDEIVRETEYTKVVVLDGTGSGNACHLYQVRGKQYVDLNDSMNQTILFQTGPIQENGVNGVQNEDLLAIVIHRLRGFQSGTFACRENAIALTKIEEALLWCDKRTNDRKARNVEGKSII